MRKKYIQKYKLCFCFIYFPYVMHRYTHTNQVCKNMSDDYIRNMNSCTWTPLMQCKFIYFVSDIDIDIVSN